MPDTPSITTLKKFAYRGNQEEYSNTYHFSGTTPSDATAWRAMFDALVLEEKKVLPATTTYVGGYGYEAGNNNAVWTFDYVAAGLTPPVGTNPLTGAIAGPGDSAMWIRWSTDDTTVNGKPIYLRKYFHPACIASAAPDTIAAATRTLLLAFGLFMENGSMPFGRKVCGPQGAIALSHLESPFSTTRTLKRRGKRPSP